MRVAIEVDGPSHFTGTPRVMPTAATLLKRRQLRHFGGQPLLSVPYFEWEGIACPSAADTLRRRQEHLRHALDEVVQQDCPL